MSKGVLKYLLLKYLEGNNLRLYYVKASNKRVLVELSGRNDLQIQPFGNIVHKKLIDDIEAYKGKGYTVSVCRPGNGFSFRAPIESLLPTEEIPKAVEVLYGAKKKSE